jgi:hypothetical protein
MTRQAKPFVPHEVKAVFKRTRLQNFTYQREHAFPRFSVLLTVLLIGFLGCAAFPGRRRRTYEICELFGADLARSLNNGLATHLCALRIEFAHAVSVLGRAASKPIRVTFLLQCIK